MNPSHEDTIPAPAGTDSSSCEPEARYKFTKEEIKVIKDCNREAFYQRCLPLGTLLGVGTYYGIRAGFLKPGVKLGASPKVIVAVVVGYFIGKFSYQTKCAERLMQLPNSRLGEILRQRRRGKLYENLEPNFGPAISLAPFSNVTSQDYYSDSGASPPSSFDFDGNRPQYEGLDESLRPSLDNPVYEEEMPPVQKTSTSYEELRKQNRDEHQQKRLGIYKDLSKPAQDYKPSQSDNKNKYGDSWE